jgi:hypothetical protein
MQLNLFKQTMTSEESDDFIKMEIIIRSKRSTLEECREALARIREARYYRMIDRCYYRPFQYETFEEYFWGSFGDYEPEFSIPSGSRVQALAMEFSELANSRQAEAV